HTSSMKFAEDIKDAPAIVFLLATPPGNANSVLMAAQNLMLAGRTLGIGSVPTTLHPTVMERFNAMFGIPSDTVFHFCIPLGYPQSRFGPTNRLPIAETCHLNRWGESIG